jgi:hypothetical protein
MLEYIKSHADRIAEYIIELNRVLKVRGIPMRNWELGF